MRTQFESEGDVRSMDVLAGLVALWREGASASLQFSRSGQTAGFELSEGELTATRSSDARFEAASILVRAGKLDEGTLSRLAFPEGSDRALVALQAGVLTRREWRWGEKIRAVEILSDLLGWIEGEYLVFRTSPAGPDEFRLPVPRLILELFLRSRDRSLVLHYLGGADVPLARSETFDSEFATFGLTADAESVVRLIDGRSTAAEISSEAPAEAFAVEKLLAALVTLGLVHAEFSRTPGAPPPEAPAEAVRDRPSENPVEPGRESGDSSESETPAAVESLEEILSQEETPVAPDGEPEEAAEPDTDLDALEPESFEPSADELASESWTGSPMADARLHDGDDRGTGIDTHDIGEGAEAHARTPEAEGWSNREGEPEPPLDLSTGVGALDRPRHGSSSALVWVLVALIAGVGAVMWLRGRGPSPTQIAAAAPTPTVAQAAAEPSSTPAEPGSATGAAATTPPAQPTTQPSATKPRGAAPVARPTRVPAPATPEAGAAETSSSARESTHQYWADRAARDAKRWKSDRKARYTIQLELACEVSSLVEAWKHDRPAGTMWVLATTFQGRPCFRVLWGRYGSREAAHQALAGAPAFFTTPRNRPVVTAVR